jgi:cyclopropane fatty-acyl-phospholipid synthase-like methyltransferase
LSIHKNGFWLDVSSDGHHFDRNLSCEIIKVLREEKISSVVDLGCGTGTYSKEFKKEGFSCDCYDGNPNTEKLTEGLCSEINLAKEINLNKKYDCVMSLEVGEHIPKEFESIFIDNIIKHSKKLVILSWAVVGQGGRGHVNEKNNDYIEKTFLDKGWKRNKEKENKLRMKSSLSWFKKTIMVYEQVENN